jgi:hypothetical protein
MSAENVGTGEPRVGTDRHTRSLTHLYALQRLGIATGDGWGKLQVRLTTLGQFTR